jgi:DNA invertase Pin-like site-specific DNA recombinase
MLVGYGRVSTEDQDLAVQIEALKAAGCEKLYSERKSGSTTEGADPARRRPGFRARGRHSGHNQDRPAGQVTDLQTFVRTLKSKGVALKATEQPVDTGTAAGHARRLRRVRDEPAPRTPDGIVAPNARGAYKGRKPSVPAANVARMLAEGGRPTDIARKLGISRASIYVVRNGRAGEGRETV